MANAHNGSGSEFEGLPLPATEEILSVGRQCLLNLTGRHFLVEIVEMDKSTIRISFPGRGYPVEGMNANLEFHDETGYYFYTTHVLQGPTGRGSGIILEKPTDLKRSTHRESCRVPTDLTVQVREVAHARYYDAELVNLSATGALIQTEGPFDFSCTIELVMSLPGEPPVEVAGEIVHVAEAPPWRRYPSHVYGIRFTDMDELADQSLSRFIWERLQEMFPSS